MAVISYLFLSREPQEKLQDIWQAFADNEGVKNTPKLQFLAFTDLARRHGIALWNEQPGGGWVWTESSHQDAVDAADRFFLQDHDLFDVVCKEVRDGSTVYKQWSVVPDPAWPGWEQEVDAA